MKDKPRRTHNTCSSCTHTHTHTQQLCVQRLTCSVSHVVKDEKLLVSVFRENKKRDKDGDKEQVMNRQKKRENV